MKLASVSREPSLGCGPNVALARAPRATGAMNGLSFGAVCPERSTGAAIIMPEVNIEAMNEHLAEISRHVSVGAIAVLVLDGAGWHTSPRLKVPGNIVLLPLPAYSPELNPVENAWEYLRGNFLSHRVWDTYEAILDACESAWNALMRMPDRIASITRRSWAIPHRIGPLVSVPKNGKARLQGSGRGRVGTITHRLRVSSLRTLQKALAMLSDASEMYPFRPRAWRAVIFGRVIENAQAGETDTAFGRQVRKIFSEQGGVEALAEQYQTVSAWHNKNDLPLLWPIHANHRSLLFRLLDLLDIRSATQDSSLLDALSLVRRLRHARRDVVLDEVDLSFAPERWRQFVAKRRSEPATLDRRALEVCVLVHLADALQAGDLFVVGSENFADYRTQLLPWADCEPRLPAYCAALGMPERGEDFAAALKRELMAAAAEVDTGFEANTELSIDPDGTPHLKQLATTDRPQGLAEFEQEVRARIRSATFSTSSKMLRIGPGSPATSVRHPGRIRSSQRRSSGICSPCSAMAATLARIRQHATRPRSPVRRHFVGSTHSTSMLTNWKPPWST
jgi:hypothetical protein